MKQQLPIDARVRRTGGHLDAQVHGETVILHGTESVYYGLNATCSRIWELLAVGATLHEMVHDLVQEYDAAADRVETDVRCIVAELLERGLVEIVAPEAI